MKKRNILFNILLIVIFYSCSKPVYFGIKPKKIIKDMITEKGEVHLGKDKIKVKYIITNKSNEQNEDIIFYLHGIGRTELEWAASNKFGKIYYEVLESNKSFKNLPVVSISIGRAFFFLEGAQDPYFTDLETLFIKDIIPYFQNKLNIKGRVYLIGHSMGGYNVLSLSLRNPDKFPVVLALSPYVAPISPFSDEFEKKGKELNMSKIQVYGLKETLTSAFQNEKKWNEYNPFFLVENSKNDNFPYIFLTRASDDLPGFNESIFNFSKLLKRKNIPYYDCEAEGDHITVCHNAFYLFLKKISEK